MKIKDYCKEKFNFIVFAVICIFLPKLVTRLAINSASEDYDIWITNSTYCSVLLTFFAFVLLIPDYVKNRRKIERLRYLVSNKESDFVNSLPEADKITESLYSELIRQIKKNTQMKLITFEEQKKEDLEFIQTWVHEIKTPIAASKLLIENGIDNPSEDVLYKIEDELTKIEDMVQKSLCYSILNDFEKDCQIEQIDLRKTINKCLQSEFTNIREKRIKLDIKDVDFEVYTDERWIGFIVKQILDNAIKYSDNEGTIHIDCIKDNTIKKLTVTDEGIGIRKEDLRRIFEKGFTGFNGRRDMTATGIGLYLSNKLALKLGHEIKIESKINEGTKVELNFRY